jgi:PhnB protein
MMQLNPYLNFNGNCEAAFTFYEQVLGGKRLMQMTYRESPVSDQAPPGWEGKILHTSMMIGNTVLMGCDAPPAHYQEPKGVFVSIGIADEAEAERIYESLSAGGKVNMPIQQTFWATRFAMLVDQFGTPWMINCSKQE